MILVVVGTTHSKDILQFVFTETHSKGEVKRSEPKQGEAE
jgi:hypothetical protein